MRRLSYCVMMIKDKLENVYFQHYPDLNQMLLSVLSN